MRTLKLASHIHSSWSDDATSTLPRLVTTLSRAGFNGALVCDHDRTMTDERWRRAQRECADVSKASGFLLVPGIEYQDPDHVVHLPVFGAVEFYGRSPATSDLLPAAHGDGAATLFAHPARRNAHERFTSSWVSHLSGIEVWNRKYDGIAPNPWALKTAAEFQLNPFASLDYHGPRQLYPLAMRVNSATTILLCDVIAALRLGTASASAFGLPIQLFGSGILGAAGMHSEAARRWAAPRIRRLEQTLGGN
jgi:hypothetical protein